MEFHPEMHRQILLNWMNSLTTDYPISRRRYYATEIPIWYCSKCNEPHLPKPGSTTGPGVTRRRSRNARSVATPKFVGETKTFDTWMDSSISALYITKRTKNLRFYRSTYPATIRTQGKDIVRTWLYYSLLRCYLLTGKAPFKHAWIGGLGQDCQGTRDEEEPGELRGPGAPAAEVWDR